MRMAPMVSVKRASLVDRPMKSKNVFLSRGPSYAGGQQGGSPVDSPNILIAGGGIGGLVTGLALLQHGFAVDIYEWASELREVGAGVQIAPNGTRVLCALGLQPTMEGIASVPGGKEVRLFSTGRSL